MGEKIGEMIVVVTILLVLSCSSSGSDIEIGRYKNNDSRNHDKQLKLRGI